MNENSFQENIGRELREEVGFQAHSGDCAVQLSHHREALDTEDKGYNQWE
jgi:hypothetical protein